jgi:glycosyltransferase involved in cell wall biosynthesis
VSDIASVLRAPPEVGGPRPSATITMSVLIPAYNAADSIGEALESVLSQRPRPHQVIVSDDGSEDDLPAATAPFRGHIEVIRGPNAGPSVARNRAAAAARGDLLALLDADDVWLPGRAAALLEAARLRPDLDIFTTDAYMVRDGSREPETYYGVRAWPDEDQATAILRSSFIFGAAAIRRHAFTRVGGFDPNAPFAEDWDLWIRMLLTGSRAALIEQPLYEYRRRPESSTGHRLELALAVIAMLGKVDDSMLTVEQRRVARSTRASWRVRAADESRARHDPVRHRLALAAVRDRDVSARDRARLLVRLAVPARQP